MGTRRGGRAGEAVGPGALELRTRGRPCQFWGCEYVMCWTLLWTFPFAVSCVLLEVPKGADADTECSDRAFYGSKSC